MIIKKIYEHAKLHVDGDFPWVHGQRWINEAQHLIATMCETGGIPDKVTIETTTPGKWHKLPKDIISIDKVYRNGVINHDFREDTQRITFKDPGKYEIEYKRIPKIVGLESDESELHELYHFPMSYWVASREQFRFNPDNPDGQRLETSFYLEIARVDQMLSKRRRVRKIKVR